MGNIHGMTPIERLARWLHNRREYARTHCSISGCGAPVGPGEQFCSHKCYVEYLDSATP